MSDMRVNGEAIRAIRRGKGVTLAALATRLRVSEGYLSRIERGQRGASAERLAVIAAVLGVPVDAITYADEGEAA